MDFPDLEERIITPAEAEELLTRNFNNRPLRKSVVTRYANDMRSGSWNSEAINPICIDSHGKLIQGQHRLQAIVDSGVPIKLHIQKNVSETAYLSMDTGAPRSFLDYERYHNPESHLSNAGIAVGRMMQQSFSYYTRLSHSALSEFIDRHREAIMFSIRCFGAGNRPAGVKSAPVVAVWARAFYTQDQDRLIEAAYVMVHGEDSSGGLAPEYKIIKEHRENCIKRGKFGDAGRRNLYGRTERVLKAFLNGEQRSKIHPATSEQFPLPEEEAAEEKEINNEVEKTKEYRVHESGAM